MIVGYARTSTEAQNLDAQLAALKAYGYEPIQTEQKRGTSRILPTNIKRRLSVSLDLSLF